MGAFCFSGTWLPAKAYGSCPFREGPTSSTHLDPSPLLSGVSIAVRRFNRRADVNARGTAQTHRAERLEATMAHATKCAAPEGNRGRDEWMTVIEMQEYMRESRSKAYDLIWPGEIDSYRLGGSSWCRGRQWTPTSSRGAAGNDGGDRSGSRPRPGTRGSLETRGARGRP